MLEPRDPSTIEWARWDRLVAARELVKRRKRRAYLTVVLAQMAETELIRLVLEREVDLDWRAVDRAVDAIQVRAAVVTASLDVDHVLSEAGAPRLATSARRVAEHVLDRLYDEDAEECPA